jgi:hypothetical protein
MCRMSPLSPIPPAPDLEVLLMDLADPQPRVCGRIACPGTFIVGKLPNAHLILPANDLEAGRLHFDIELTPEYCRLNNSTDKGTFVNGMVVYTQCDLRHGDLIRAGRSVFRVEVCRQGVPIDLAPAPTMVIQPAAEHTKLADVEPVPPSDPVAVLHLPGYRLIRALGTGGFGSVYLAENRAGQQVACKLIRRERALDADACARFRREANHLRDVSHRHIVGFREAGEHQGLLYLVMDYVPGKNLAELLRQNGRFAVGRAVRLICQVLSALGELHNNGVVHRDVKPSNILVHAGSAGEEARLADFGLAKAYQSADIDSMTLPGVQGGTLAFASPEMLTDFRRAGLLADQYGAAATLYNLLTGCYIHDAANAVQMLDRIRSADAVPLGQRRPGLPDDLVAAIHRALDREPRLRFPTVGSFRVALSPFAD